MKDRKEELFNLMANFKIEPLARESALMVKAAELVYQVAVDNACEYLEENLISYWQQKVTDPTEFIENFRKAIEK